jgi:dihydroxyacetone kinase
MLDAQLPFVQEFQSVVAATGDLVAAWKSAAAVAVTAAADTAQMEPTLGRGKVLSKRSIGHADPGASSFRIIAAVVAEMFTDGS